MEIESSAIEMYRRLVDYFIVADLRYIDEGRGLMPTSKKGGAPIYYFAKFSRKLYKKKTFGSIGGHASPAPKFTIAPGRNRYAVDSANSECSNFKSGTTL